MTTDSEIGKRITIVRNRLKLSVGELAQRCGVHRATVYRWEGGESNPGLQVHTISVQLGVNSHWLLTGDGMMEIPAGVKSQITDVHKLTQVEAANPVMDAIENIKKQVADLEEGVSRTIRQTSSESDGKKSKGRKTSSHPNLPTIQLPNMHNLPILDSVAADRNPIALGATKHFVLVDSRFDTKTHYGLQVKGSSMQNTMLEGDVVIVEKHLLGMEQFDEDNPTQKSVWKKLHFEAVVFSLDGGEPQLKRFFLQDAPRKKSGFICYLKGDNPASPLMPVEKESTLQVFGVVRQVIRDPKNIA